MWSRFNGILSDLLEGLEMLKSCQAMMTALVERWPDCTHTFHFQFRKMIIMPLEFTAIMGFTFIGQQIFFNITEDPAGLGYDFLGCPLEFRVNRGGLISYD